MSGISHLARAGQGLLAGGLIGTLGGLIGLGGAEFRLPVLVGLFRLDTLEAIIFNKAMSLVVVAVALFARLGTIPVGEMLEHAGVVLNLLAGSLIGAWWAAGHAMTMRGVGLIASSWCYWSGWRCCCCPKPGWVLATPRRR
jgi:hypothetical protein